MVELVAPLHSTHEPGARDVVFGLDVLRAHGHEPEWARAALSPGSRAQLEAVNLHFHDLHHEAGCRWLEEGWPIHHVQEMLGHANLSQTSTYLHASEIAS